VTAPIVGATKPQLVVVGAGLEAAVQDADESIAELAERGAVAGAAGAELVVVSAGAGRIGQCLERLQAWNCPPALQRVPTTGSGSTWSRAGSPRCC
jgi:hypothetical protein